jgi:HEAT repeat protein
MPKKPRKKAEDSLLMALACGATVDSAARQCKLCVRTVYRRLKDPDFRFRLQELRADMFQRTAATLTAAGSEAVRTLLELLKSANPPATRLGAARSVLEMGMKAREFAELEDRLAALEGQAELNANGPHMESRRGSLRFRRDAG